MSGANLYYSLLWPCIWPISSEATSYHLHTKNKSLKWPNSSQRYVTNLPKIKKKVVDYECCAENIDSSNHFFHSVSLVTWFLQKASSDEASNKICCDTYRTSKTYNIVPQRAPISTQTVEQIGESFGVVLMIGRPIHYDYGSLRTKSQVTNKHSFRKPCMERPNTAKYGGFFKFFVANCQKFYPNKEYFFTCFRTSIGVSEKPCRVICFTRPSRTV